MVWSVDGRTSAHGLLYPAQLLDAKISSLTITQLPSINRKRHLILLK